jgi:hypothetical protein
MKNLCSALALALAAGAFFVWSPPTVQAGPALDAALRAHCSRTTCTIRNNPGGDIQLFQAAAQEVLEEGKYLVIDGFCASACVILADIARSNTCLTSKAQMAVHKASVIEVTGTARVQGREVPVGRLLRREDPPQSPDIDRWIRSNGGYPSKGVKVIPIKEARKFWPMCR